MRFVIILIILVFTITPCNAGGLLQRKNYKQNFLQDALRAEKRNNNDQAFHSYEKALYYYKKDSSVLEAYASFCERQKYFDKAQELYNKLFTLTKDQKYLHKRDLNIIKNGNLTKTQLEKLFNSNTRTKEQQKEINIALIFYFSYKEDWQNTKKACESVDKKYLDKNTITSCIVASEKTKDKKGSYGFIKRYSELYPDNVEIIKKVISVSDEIKDYKTEETYLKRFSELLPKDNGIKYQLAGFYEARGDYKKASKIYESLIASGDKSEHVKNSYAYNKAKASGKYSGTPSQSGAAPIALSGYKLAEKQFYDALNAKNYESALSNLNKMLKKDPKNTKLLKHRVDIAFAQNDYKNAILYFEKIEKIKPLSIEDKEFLAFLHSKAGNTAKSTEIIEDLISKSQENSTQKIKLLNLALDYSMAEKNWSKANSYLQKLLVLEPDSEKLIKLQGDLYSMNNNFPAAIGSYENLIEKYPKIEHQLALANLYMANQNFDKAQTIFEPIYKLYPNSPELIDSYLNALLAQQKISQAYWVIKNRHLEKTKIGYIVLGDMSMKDKEYEEASLNYQKALEFEPESPLLQNKLAGSYRMLKHLNSAETIYDKILEKDPENIGAKLGLGYLEIDRKNYPNARTLFEKILVKTPDYRPAKIGIANSYVANDDNFKALETLRAMPADEETNLMQAKILYRFGQYTDHFKILPNPFNSDTTAVIEPNLIGNPNDLLSGAVSEDAKALKAKIKRDRAVVVIPSYSFFFQQLAAEFKLDYHKFGMRVSQETDKNRNVFMEYNNIIYSSGGLNQQNNVVNEFRAGTIARPSERWEYRADLGVKSFEFGNGAMLITDSWIKHYFNDKYTLKLGFRRNNIEQSYISAVGSNIDGVFTGRAVDNKIYLEGKVKLPNQCYAFAMGSYGAIYAQNLITNMYYEAMLGVGKTFYSNPDHNWINLVSADIISYNSSYQYNLLNLYSNTGQLFGGYFSPSFFNADTINIRAEGKIKNTHLNWGIKAFGGIQTAITPDKCAPTWGVSPYISYHVNDHISINAIYNHFTYADLVRDQFMISAVIRGFKKNAKN